MIGRFWIFFTLLSHWRRNPVQLAAIFLGVALATALWSGVQAINGEARASYARAEALLGGDTVASLLPIAGKRLPQKDFITLRRQGVLVSPVLEGTIEIKSGRYRLLGIEPVSMPAISIPEGLSASENGLAFLLPPWQTQASTETIARLESQPGDVLALSGTQTLPPLVVDPSLAPGVLVVDIGVAQRLLGAPEQLSRLLLHPGVEVDTQLLQTLRLRQNQPSESSDLVGLTDSFHLNLTAFAFLAFAVGLFIVHSAMGLATEQRLAMFRTLRTCGVSSRDLVAVALVELLLIIVAAGLCGVVLGYVIAGVLLPDVASSLRGLYGVAVPGSLSLNPTWWLSSLGMSLLGGLVAAGSTLWTVYCLPPLASAQPEAWRSAQLRRLRWCKMTGLGLLAIAFTSWTFGGSLEIGFLTLASVLLGAALLLPVLLEQLLRLGFRRAEGPRLQWAFADMRQQLSGLSLALMALLLALSANIGVGTMVEGFRETFLKWLDQRLAAEVYVRGADAYQGQSIQDWALKRPDVDAVLPTKSHSLAVDGFPTDLIGIVDHATYRDLWPLLEAAPGAWDDVFAGEGVMISEQIANRLDLELGDVLPMVLEGLEIVGVYADYGNPKGQATLSLDRLETAFAQVEDGGIGLRLDPAASGQLIADLQATFDLPFDASIDQRALKVLAVEIFEQTFAVTAALNVLTLAVAGFAVFTSLLTLGDRRLLQLAPLWSMGLTRWSLALAEWAKTLCLAALTCILAIPLGILLAYLLVTTINVQAFGWRLPLELYPDQWLRLGFLSLLIASLASMIPVLRLYRMSPARLLKVFADAR
ncbi:MAG: FtsX-like permease family protein [Pseudomonadota bacterium]